MVTHTVQLTIPDATAEQFYDFMIMPSDERYSEWWPQEHLQFHITKHGSASHLGDEVFYDEYVGDNRRLSFHATATAANRPNLIVWKMKKAYIELPAYLELSLHDSHGGLLIKHELKIGYEQRPGRLLDPLIRLYFNKSFRLSLEEHCREEWPKLAALLKSQ